MFKPLTEKKVKYFGVTDLNALTRSLEMGLSAVEFRVFQYLNCCIAHEIEIVDTEAAKYLEISLEQFYDIGSLLVEKNLIPEPVIYLGGNENV